MLVGFDVRGQKMGDSFWVIDWYFVQKQWLKFLKDRFVFYTNMQFHKMLIDGLEPCGLLVDYCDAFISC